MKNHCKPKPYTYGIPVCDYLNGTTISIEKMIDHAHRHSGNHGYFPPKPIVSMSHPACACHLICWPPTSVEDIPDSAPGIPTFGDYDDILQYKREIFERISSGQMKVDRFTILSKEILKESEHAKAYTVDEWDVRKKLLKYPAFQREVEREETEEEYHASAKDVWVKTAADSWHEDIQPVAIATPHIFKSFLGPIRPIPDTYVGLRTHSDGQYSLVFVGDMARHSFIPNTYLTDLKLRKHDPSEIKPVMFVDVDGSIGIVISIFDDDKILCFVPDLGTSVFVDYVEPLEII